MANVHPFAAGNYNGHQCYHVTAEDRMQAVKTFTKQQCLAALELTDLQKTVERAVRSRIRSLERD
ncbi:hypothetical protein [Jeongeupia chitinilytica]|uniref:Uncharacterized protein n=1 Tax=Jeongeupia chitinilytica TaxID=1041641 RepID=A0ABQ3H279_9NEIS|nr:hypothetical protein [Jeongeupia chitinilytica]GHD63775.1 hypothetical protein GCM10007350_21930 [Jeongeupia chitinilytica]